MSASPEARLSTTTLWSRLPRLLLGGVLFVVGGYLGVRYGAEAYFTPPPEPEDLGPVAAGEEIRTEHVVVAVDEPRAWPNLFGPTHDSVAPETAGTVLPWGEDGPAERWRIPCGTGYSSPVVWRERLILLHRLGDEEVVSCLATADGSTIWEHLYPTAFVCTSHYTHGPYSTPATDGERVYTLGAEGRFLCLELDDGAVVWEHDLRAEFGVEPDVFGMGHSPLLWGNRVVLSVGGTTPDSGIIAFDKSDGTIVWQATDHGPSYATPQPARIHDRDFLFVLTARGLVALDPDDGEVFWTIPYDTDIVDGYNAVTPVVRGDLVLMAVYGKGAKVVRILPDGRFAEVWDSVRTLTSHYTPIVGLGDHVYGIHTNDKSLRCVHLATGEVAWRWRSPLARSTQIAVGDRLVVQGERGRLALVEAEPDGLVEHAITKRSLFPGESIYSAPAYVDGALFLRSEREAVCLELEVE